MESGRKFRIRYRKNNRLVFKLTKLVSILNKIKKLKSKDVHLNDLLKGSLLTLVIRITGMFIGYILVFILSKKTGASGVGYYNLINQILVVFAMIISLGLNVSVLRFIGQFNTEGLSNLLKFLHRQIIKIVVPFSLLISSLIFIFSEQISLLLFNKLEFSFAIFCFKQCQC